MLSDSGAGADDNGTQDTTEALWRWYYFTTELTFMFVCLLVLTFGGPVWSWDLSLAALLMVLVYGRAAIVARAKAHQSMVGPRERAVAFGKVTLLVGLVSLVIWVTWLAWC